MDEKILDVGPGPRPATADDAPRRLPVAREMDDAAFFAYAKGALLSGEWLVTGKIAARLYVLMEEIEHRRMDEETDVREDRRVVDSLERIEKRIENNLEIVLNRMHGLLRTVDVPRVPLRYRLLMLYYRVRAWMPWNIVRARKEHQAFLRAEAASYGKAVDPSQETF